MDAAEIARRAEAAREFSHVVDGRSYKLRLPTRVQMQMLVLDHVPTTAEKGEYWDRLRRPALELALFGWDGVRLGDLLPDGGDEAQAFDRVLVPVLFESHPNVEDELGLELIKRMAERTARREADEKNSSSA